MPDTEAIATWELGPSGGQSGDDFSDQSSLRNMASVPRLVSVIVQCERYIDAIGFMLGEDSINLTSFTLDPKVGWRDSTVDGPSRVGLLGMHGGPGGKRHEIHLQDGEFVEQISGKHGTYVDSVKIRTSRKIYPEASVEPGESSGEAGSASIDSGVESAVEQRYGGEGGSVSFSYTAPKGYQIIGICGRAGQLLDALGVVLCARP